MKPYPLLFQPEMKQRVWGGRRLEQFGLKLPEGRIGEGWMIGDHPNGTTKVLNGELAGQGLHTIRESFGEAWFGSKAAASLKNGRFPLLIKLLDCEDDLSIQVHPNDDYNKLPAGELGKTEMWYILEAKPGATIIYGLKPGVTRSELAQAIEEDRILDCLQEVPVSAGDSFYIPAGTVHALKAGVLVAEIQQNSDTTYRLYDYNRPGLDGKPRELHIEDSLNVMTYGDTGASQMTTEITEPHRWLTLAQSPYFHTEKGIVSGAWQLSASEESFVIHIVCDGKGAITWDNSEIPLTSGTCVLVPAALGEYALKGDMTVLRSRLP
jgi:mannose-6-phosphate isomerase